MKAYYEQSNNVREYLNTLFPQFEPSLKAFLAEHATVIHMPAGEVILRTGQYIKSTMMIVEGCLKLYREGDNVAEFFTYYLALITDAKKLYSFAPVFKQRIRTSNSINTYFVFCRSGNRNHSTL